MRRTGSVSVFWNTFIYQTVPELLKLFWQIMRSFLVLPRCCHFDLGFSVSAGPCEALAFSCGDVLHEEAAATETNLKGPGLRNVQQTFRIANTAWTVLPGFASQFLSYTRAGHVSNDS